jgi:DNA-binding transcriptional LysR family regulator
VTTTEAAVQAAVDGVGFIRTPCYQVADPIDAGDLQLIIRDFEPELAPIQLLPARRETISMNM